MIARSPLAIATDLLLIGCGRIDALAVVDPASAVDPTQTCSPTITQSSSQAITLGNSVGCTSGPPGYFNFNTSYWRAFNMATFTGSQEYDITSVSFGVETARSGSGLGQPLLIRLYTNNGGAFPSGNRTQIQPRPPSFQPTVWRFTITSSQEIFTTLPPGTYAAILAGKNGGTGTGLVEVYNLQ